MAREFQRARIIRVPLGAGANNYAGLEIGPFSIEHLARKRIADLQLDATPRSTSLPFRYWLDGDSDMVEPAPAGPAQDTGDFETIQHLPSVSKTCCRLRDAVARLLRDSRDDPVLPVVLGGDHSIAIGTIAGVREAHPDKRLGLLWIDSHADYHTGYFGERFGEDEYDRWHRPGPAEKTNRKGTTFSGHIHGMSMAVACGFGEERLLEVFSGRNFVSPEDVVVLGMRDVDREEREWLVKDGVYCLSARQIAYQGVPEVTRQAVARLRQRGVDELHISVDIDVLDGDVVPGTGTRVPGGLSFRETDLLIKLVRDWLDEAGIPVVSFELVEVNPMLDEDGQTAQLAAQLLCAFLGEEIQPGERFPFDSSGEEESHAESRSRGEKSEMS